MSMAGAFTHFIISNFGKDREDIIGEELSQILNRHFSFLFLGSVSPDLPYLSVKTGEINWANLMHYEKTNSIVQSGHNHLKTIWSKKTLFDEIKFVWLMGYVSHVIADVTIHPIIQAIVGPYRGHEEDHRICEMTQDSLLYFEMEGGDLKYDEFSERIRICKDSEYLNYLMNFWKGLLLINYADKNETPHPRIWFETYSRAIDTSEGDSGFAAISRHIGMKNYIYRTKDDIEKNHHKDQIRYYNKIKLPDGTLGSFKPIAYEKAINNVTSVWKRLYDGLSDSIFAVNEVIKDWNLDTAVENE